MADSAAVSKSAKRRAAKKNREGDVEVEESPPVIQQKVTTEDKPKPAAQPAKAEAEPKAKAKAKAMPKCVSCGNVFADDAIFCGKCGAKHTQAAAAPKAEPKVAAAPKAEPKVAAAPKAEPKQAVAKSKAEPKNSAAKPTAKSEPKPAPKDEEDEPKKKQADSLTYMFEDDGAGGDWEEASGLSKKQQKQKEAKERQKAEEAKMIGGSGQAVVGKLPPGAIFVAEPAKAGAKAKAKAGEPAVSQSVSAVPGSKITAATGNEAPETKGAENKATASIPVPPEKIGRIIGPKGATLKMITEKTGVDRIDTTGDVCVITGEPAAVAKAEVAVRELIDKGFTSLAFENFNEQTVMVHPSNFSDIIGQKGAIIRKIKEELKVEVNIPQNVTKDSKGSYGKKKYPVTIAGASQAVEQAKECINDIVYYKHHKITHEGYTHEELQLEEWTYKFIIGPKGSEMRHIQNSFKVSVNIPRENVKDTGANPNVLIVGPEDQVQRAKNHIEKVIYNAEHNPGGRGRDDAPLGDERDADDKEEDWMSPYLYKRR